MPMLTRLTLILAAGLALASAAAAPAGAADCQVRRNNACAHDGAACGRGNRGVCQTLRHRQWRRVIVSCSCRMPRPHRAWSDSHRPDTHRPD